MEDSEYTVGPGKVCRVLTDSETKELRSKWIKSYCKNKQGANTKDYLWHIFSYGKYPSIEGKDALKEYSSKKAVEFIVLPNNGEFAITTDKLPEECSLSDYLVFPENMAWTMAFTHEEGWLGPYFAKHALYDALQKDNEMDLQKAAKKQKEIELAKSKGWI